MSVRRERKYAYIRYLQGGYSLADANRLAKTVSAASTNEYMASKDRKDLLSIEGGLFRLIVTREAARDITKAKFSARPGVARREEAIASFATAFKRLPPLDYTREPAIRGKGKPAPPRIGSSKNKVKRTTVLGAKPVLRDLRFLFKSLRDLVNQGKKVRRSDIDKVAKSVTATIKTGGK